MVNTTVEKLSPTRAKLTITVTPDELKPSIDHAYQHIAEQITIPGFRKGKVPAPIIDQRVGREEVLNHAVSEGLDRFYRDAVTAENVRVLGRPEADVTEWPNVKDFTGDLVIAVEVDVRPEFELPKLEDIELTIDSVEVTDEDVENELETLRGRFGTLVTVDRPVATGDFVQVDLVATIDGVQVDTANNISYEVGSGELLAGIDEALESLTAGESTTFESTLVGGDNAGQTAEIALTLNAVKVRELPEADDDFAQIASQFDTIDELRTDLREQAKVTKTFGQGAQARDKLVEKLLELVEIPVPEKLVLDEVHRHLEQEGRLEDDVHRAEVTEESERIFRNQILLDTIVEQEGVQVGQGELTQYLIQNAAQYGMEPGEFIQILSQSGQLPAMLGELQRSKALSVVLSKVKVVDDKGQEVDLSAFTAGATENPEDAIVPTDLGGHDHDHDHHGHDHDHDHQH